MNQIRDKVGDNYVKLWSVKNLIFFASLCPRACDSCGWRHNVSGLSARTIFVNTMSQERVAGLSFRLAQMFTRTAVTSQNTFLAIAQLKRICSYDHLPSFPHSISYESGCSWMQTAWQRHTTASR